ncbi:MAG TPA: Na+/H+ antiporter [Nevskiaceae bacterium]|nr:Na+/H+ antiporter [Nevskiaceae bacterium]
MGSIEVVLAMLLAVLASSYLTRAIPVSLPTPIVQIVLGGIIAGVFHQGVTLEPAVFFLLFLPPLLFLDGWQIPKDGLLRDKLPVLELAIGLVVFTVVGAGYVIHWLIPAMPMAVAFALAAIVSPTDPVAVSAITSRVPVPKRLMHILEGESLLNDASGLVCFQFAVAAAMTGTFSLHAAAASFAWVALVGLACGVLFTLGVSTAQQWFTRRFGEDGGSSILVNLLIPFGAYLLAEEFKASGILAAVAAGVTMSYVELTGRSMGTTRLARSAVWGTIQFALNGIMFVLLGEQLPSIVRGAVASVHASGQRGAWWLIVYALVITILLAALRYAWVKITVRLHMLRHAPDETQRYGTSWRLTMATSLAGVRGAVTLAGVLTLPLALPGGAAFPERDTVIFLAAIVILFSLIGASIGLPILLKGLDLPGNSTRQAEQDRARSAAAHAAVEAVRQKQADLQKQASARDADVVADAASRVIAIYQRRIHAGGEDAAGNATGLRAADAAERSLRLAALAAERTAVRNLVRGHRISDATSRWLEREIDMVEALYH